MKKLSLIFVLGLILLSQSYGQDKSVPKFSGLMFGDAFYNIQQRDTSKKDINGFQFRRIYITTDYTISENFDSRFRLEADQSANSNTAGGKIGVMVKDAYLKWKNIFQGSDMLFGVSPTPAFDVSEGLWGYRSVEKTIMDLNGIVGSRDLGIDLKGKITDDGMAKYWIKIGNNSGNAPETNKYKRYYGLFQLAPVKNLNVTLYGDFASSGKIKNTYTSEMVDNGAFVFAGMVNYSEKDKYSIGVETFLKSQQNGYRNTVSKSYDAKSTFGLSLFAWASITDQIRILGRYDMFDPNTNSDVKDDQTSLILAGIDFKVDKNVSIIPNIEVFNYQKNVYGKEAKDIVARATFSYNF